MLKKAEAIYHFIIKHSLIFSCAILILAFIFSSLPYFIWFPIPEFSPDTFDYFYYVEKLNHGTLPAFDNLPMGFTMFAYIIGLISSKIITVIYIQNILIISSALLLIYVTNKYYTYVSIFVSIALSVYLMDSFTMKADTGLATESLYSSSLILISGLFIWLVNSKNKYLWISFSIALIFPALIRSNGLYIYFIPILLIAFMLISKYKYSFYLYLLVPFIIMNLLWAGYNYKTTDSFTISNGARIQMVVKNKMKLPDKPENLTQKTVTPNTKPLQRAAGESFITFKITNFFIPYLFEMRIKKPQFYYTYIKDRYRDLYISNQMHNKEYKMNNNLDTIPESLRKLTYKEFFIRPNLFKNDISMLDISNKRSNKWLLLYHIYYKIHSLVFWNILWVICWLLIATYSIILFIKSKFKSNELFIFIMLFLIHFLSIIIVSFAHETIHIRYVTVSEFIVFLNIALLPIILKNHQIIKSTH